MFSNMIYLVEHVEKLSFVIFLLLTLAILITLRPVKAKQRTNGQLEFGIRKTATRKFGLDFENSEMNTGTSFDLI